MSSSDTPRLSRAQEELLGALSRIEPAFPQDLAKKIYGTPNSLRVGWVRNTLNDLRRKGLATFEDSGTSKGLIWSTVAKS
jgi:hypothetical protein